MDTISYYHDSASASASTSASTSNSTGPSSRDTSAYSYSQNPFDTTTSMYLNQNQSQSQQNLYPSFEALNRPNSPSQDVELPSVQVTHPTPTKAIKFRRKSAGALSISTASSFEPSPVGRSPFLPSPGSASGSGSLEVVIDPSPRSRARSPDDDSEVEREKRELADKQARVREKGRDRQRRKRERDKKAKEAQPNVINLTPLTTATHLPVPSSKTGPHSLSISVPSSVSSISSSLPQSSSYFSVSPGQNSFGFTASTSVSGASTPGTLFSPGTSAPSYSPDTALNTAFFGIGLESTMSPVGLLDIPEKIVKRGTRSKAVAASSNVTGAAASRKASSDGLFQQPKIVKSAKRRKSETLTDQITGLGMTGTDTDKVSQSWKGESTHSWAEQRPKPRRTASDGMVIKSSHEREWARSPTPPPVPTLPNEYRKKSRQQLQQSEYVNGPAPSPQAETFAARALFLLTKDETETGWLREQIGFQAEDLEGMQTALAGTYDRWMLERSMKEMTLESREGETSSSTSLASQNSGPASPVASSALFFTPASSRQRAAAPVAVQESPLAATTHTRQRSLSSASMLARGLHIIPQHANTNTGQPWSQHILTTPLASYAASASEPQSDGTVSPSLQTPSTGEGAFSIPDNMSGYHGHWRSATDPTGQRTFTTTHQTPSHQTTQNVDWTNVPQTCPPAGMLLESPLSMAAQIKHGGMPPPPPVSTNVGDTTMVDIHAQAQQVQPLNTQAVSQPNHQRHFSTPVASRSGSMRAVVPVPYTPPTPVPMRGHNHTLHDGPTTIPVWYNPSFIPQPGDSPTATTSMAGMAMSSGGAHGYAHRGMEMYVDLGQAQAHTQGQGQQMMVQRGNQ